MNKVALADVLWRAANEFLSPTGRCAGRTEGYSCAAVVAAVDSMRAWRIARAFLRDLGCDTNSHVLFSEREHQFTPDTQGARYIWLLLAMHCAEDEGIYVEVAQ